MSDPGREPAEAPAGEAPTSGAVDVAVIAAARAARQRVDRRRARAAVAVSVTVTVVWLVFVSFNGHWDRVADRWEVALTMVFGSFVAGSTPQGGGAVAFPVLTKVVEAPAEVARTFSLCIQTVGMGAAAASIVLRRRPVVWRAVVVATPPAAAAFVLVAYGLGDADAPFRPSILPGPWVKVVFTVVLAAMAIVVVLGRRMPVRLMEDELPPVRGRVLVGAVLAGAVGGAASALVGSGADVAVYLFLVVLLGLHLRIGIPTSVVVMAAVSAVGFVTLGLVDGQLSVELAGDRVVAVGGEPVGGAGLDASRTDLYGMWLAAVPVVCWGAPIGAWAASRMGTRALVALVVGLAAAETVSTALFLDELRSDPALAAFGVLGLVGAAVGLAWMARNRTRLLGLPPLTGDRTLSRAVVDADHDWSERLAPPRPDIDHHGEAR